MTYTTISTPKGKSIKAWVRDLAFEEAARKQLFNIADMPFVYKEIAVMPDVHLGKGCTVGSVIPMVNAIIPAAVGVDIGCGMRAVKTNIKADHLPDSLYPIRTKIEALVPHGRSHKGDIAQDIGGWKGSYPEIVEIEWRQLNSSYQDLIRKHPGALSKSTLNHLGTLGSGNHFIEICLDESQYVWIMLHSGSRGCGNRIGTYFINLAQKQMDLWHIILEDKDLAYFPKGTESYGDYMRAMHWAQKYADVNRKVMMGLILDYLKTIWPDMLTDQAIDCRHNYLSMEKHYSKNLCVIRKGAIRAQEDEWGIIPGSMGARSFIVQGLGNKDSFESCSHGAGRILSRVAARNKIKLQEHIQSTQGVECKKDESVLDESPKAYKDIEKVMAAQNDLVKIRHTLKQVLCVKG